MEIEEKRKRLKGGSFWVHSVKRTTYMVNNFCTIEATDTPAIMYMCLNTNQRDDHWVRPVEEFLEKFEPLNVNAVQFADFIQENDDAKS